MSAKKDGTFDPLAKRLTPLEKMREHYARGKRDFDYFFRKDVQPLQPEEIHAETILRGSFKYAHLQEPSEPPVKFIMPKLTATEQMLQDKLRAKRDAAIEETAKAFAAFGISAAQAGKSFASFGKAVQHPMFKMPIVNTPVFDDLEDSSVNEERRKDALIVAKRIDMELNDPNKYHEGAATFGAERSYAALRDYLTIHQRAWDIRLPIALYVNFGVMLVHSSRRTPKNILAALVNPKTHKRIKAYAREVKREERVDNRFVDAHKDIGASLLNLARLIDLVRYRVDDSSKRLRALTSAMIAIRGSLHPSVLSINPVIFNRWREISDMRCGPNEARLLLATFRSNLHPTSVSMSRLAIIDGHLNDFIKANNRGSE